MRTHQDIAADKRVRLTRQDLIAFEHFLRDSIRAFLPFTSASLHFPQPGQVPGGQEFAPFGNEPVYFKDQAELALPLTLDGELMGCFMARGVRLKAPKTELRYLPALATACLEKILWRKACVTDPATGLFTRDHLLSALTRDIDLIKSGIATDPESLADPAQPYSGCLGLIFLDLDYFQWINENFGYRFGDSLVAEVGAMVADIRPAQALAARVGEDSFAVLLPDTGPGACFQVAEQIRERISRRTFPYAVSGETVTLTASLGFVTYPQDLRGVQLTLPAMEQARILARKAKSAVITAKDFGRDRIFAFSDIARRGGRILEILPLERVCVSLGRGVDAQEGMRFLVWSPKYPPSRKTSNQAAPDSEERLSGRYPAMYKGEISLMEVQEEVAFGEVLHLSDPGWPIEPGDRLTLIQEKDSIVTTPEKAGPPQRDAFTGLLSYRDFIGLWTREKHNHQNFSLSLIQVQEPPKSRPGEFEKDLDDHVRKTAGLAQEVFGATAVGARYSLGNILFFHPDQSAADVQAQMRRFADQAKDDLAVDLAVGVAGYPCLTFHKTDVLENTRKALEHARLLPSPQVAAFDSVTLNLAADKLFNAGDLYGAVEQYKLSLLADEDNAIARNSLGICLARLGKLDQAKHHFEHVIEADPKDIMALYNLASVLQATGEADRARETYRRCLKLDPGHRFSLIRLGILSEAKDPAVAQDYFTKAAALPGGEKLAARHLARLSLTQHQPEAAREFLHQALVHNHKDAQSLHLLARLYLEGHEDPEIAETLARQSAALRPDRPEHWRTLAEALTAQGKQAEADEALSQVK